MSWADTLNSAWEAIRGHRLRSILTSLGILIGIAIPLSVQFFTDDVQIPISPVSIIVAFTVSLLVGLLFGILPANKAARMNPTDALRFEDDHVGHLAFFDSADVLVSPEVMRTLTRRHVERR